MDKEIMGGFCAELSPEEKNRKSRQRSVRVRQERKAYLELSAIIFAVTILAVVGCFYKANLDSQAKGKQDNTQVEQTQEESQIKSVSVSAVTQTTGIDTLQNTISITVVDKNGIEYNTTVPLQSNQYTTVLSIKGNIVYTDADGYVFESDNGNIYEADFPETEMPAIIEVDTLGTETVSDDCIVGFYPIEE